MYLQCSLDCYDNGRNYFDWNFSTTIETIHTSDTNEQVSTTTGVMTTGVMTTGVMTTAMLTTSKTTKQTHTTKEELTTTRPTLPIATNESAITKSPITKSPMTKSPVSSSVARLKTTESQEILFSSTIEMSSTTVPFSVTNNVNKVESIIVKKSTN